MSTRKGARMMRELKKTLKRILPKKTYQALHLLRATGDWGACLSFLTAESRWGRKERFSIIRQLYRISMAIESPHTQQEILCFIRTILNLPETSRGVAVEAGCYKGGSTAKFSLAADLAGRQLVVFDSFQGIPENDEPQQTNIFGLPASFAKGQYSGSLEEVRANVDRFGKLRCCRFVPGWFEDTLPHFKEPVSCIYLDVDLASSTRTCVKHLYPLLEPGGVLYSQDGHLPLVIEVLNDEDFWRREVGCRMPPISGLGQKKLIRIQKEA